MKFLIVHVSKLFKTAERFNFTDCSPVGLFSASKRKFDCFILEYENLSWCRYLR